jgi:uncharacterized protein YlxP (DUF503 family)
MPALGVLTLEIHIEHAHSLKDRRQVVLSLKERLRHRHNISIAEIDGQNTWQRATLAAAAISSSRQHAQHVLEAVERDAAHELGGMLTNAYLEWLE